jgi:hypothetical protein
MAKKPVSPRVSAKLKLYDDGEFVAAAESMTVRQLFVKRMAREGKLLLYQQRVAELEAAGSHPETAQKDAAGEFGRFSRDRERKLYCQYLAEQHLLARKSQDADLQRMARGNRDDAAYDEAVKGLPDVADPAAELKWIRSHPAMTTKDRRRSKSGKDDPVLISARDVNKRHGVAPSKAAVQMLQHWANRPEKFFELMMSEQKKGGAPVKGARRTAGMGSVAGDSSDDDDLTDVDNLLGGK